MGLTTYQKVLRKRHLGSSDMAQLLGLSPYSGAGPANVYNDKVDPIECKTLPVSEEEPDVDSLDFGEEVSSDSQTLGNLMEPLILNVAADRLGLKLDLRNRFRVSKGRDKGICACNLDGPVAGQPSAIEAKLVGRTYAGDWRGEQFTDQVPDYVAVQGQHQMYCADLDELWVCAALPGDWLPLEFQLYHLTRHDSIIEVLVNTAIEFTEKHIRPKIPPDDWTSPPLEQLQAIKRLPNKTVKMPNKIVKVWQDWRTARLMIEKVEEVAKLQVLHALKDAEAGDCVYNGRPKQITFMEEGSRATADLDAIRRDGLGPKYITQGTHRTLRIKEKKT